MGLAETCIFRFFYLMSIKKACAKKGNHIGIPEIEIYTKKQNQKK